MVITKEKNKLNDYYENYDVILEEDNLEFMITFGGNGDLYWTLKDLSVTADNFQEYDKKTLNFSITKENMEVYQLFMDLYNDIKNCDFHREEDKIDDELDIEPFYDDEEEYPAYNDDRDDYIDRDSYKMLFHDGIVEWHSDETRYDVSDVVKISLGEDVINVEFTQGKGDEYSMNFPGNMSIRFRNSGSTCTPFNQMFMRHYNRITAIDFDYHQIHMEEYLLSLRKSTKNS